MKKTLSLIFSALILSMLATSCNNSENNWPQNVSYDIATLVESNSSGTVCEIQQLNDSPVATLLFTNVKGLPAETWKPNSRIIIGYTMDDDMYYNTGTGTLYAIGPVYNGVITEGTGESTNQWLTKPQNVLDVWRTGIWLNIITQCAFVNYEQLPKKFELVVDSETLESEYPEVHLIYEPSENVNANTQTFYASINIENVWNLPNVKGIKLTYLNNAQGKEMLFEKTQN